MSRDDEERNRDRHRRTIEEGLELLTRQAAEINRLATLTVRERTPRAASTRKRRDRHPPNMR
jgi:hypothetical protein